MNGPAWQALVLAAGRPGDPLAMAHGVPNKCAIPVAGIAMLRRVYEALAASGLFARIVISTESEAMARSVLGPSASVIAPASSAPGSVLAAISAGAADYPVLITTGDHALLTPAMIEHFCAESENSGADFTAGLARAQTIRAAYPEAVRTYFHLGGDSVSGCNLFAIHSSRGLKLLEHWQYLEGVRKKPWRLVAAFGPVGLLRYAFGLLTLESAFALVSEKLKLSARAIVMPYAEAAIDIDKPEDLRLAERILAKRAGA